MKLRVRMLRGGFLVAAATALAVAGISSQGCGGGDDTNATTNPTDGAVANDSPGSQSDAPPVGDIEVIASDVNVYVGAKAHLDASQSKRPTGSVLTFEWTLKSAPQGSAITTASISGADTETPTIDTDVAGDYVLTAKASAGPLSASKDVVVHALNASVFYVRMNIKDVPPTVTYNAVSADGTGEHALSCKQQVLPDSFNGLLADAGALADAATQDGGVAQQFGMFMIETMMNAMLGVFTDVAIDTYEAPAGMPSKAAFAQITLGGDGGNKEIALVIADTNNSCSSPPTKLHQIGSITGQNAMVLQPHFSPDGSRISYLEDRGEQEGGSKVDMHVNVVGSDGSNFRDLGPYCTSDDTCWGRNLYPRRPQWLDPTHVGWIRVIDAKNNSNPPFSWEIVVANDATGGTVSRYMSCSSFAVPYSFAFISDGLVLANLKPTQDASEDLVVLDRDASGSCKLVRNLTKLPLANKGSFARDFAISPDGTTVAYVHHLNPITDASTDPNTPPTTCTGADASVEICQNFGLSFTATGGGKLYLVPLDGSAAPHAAGGTELDALFGPRFISSGSRLAWNGLAPLPAGFDAGVPDANGLDSSIDFSHMPVGVGLNAMNVMPTKGGPVVSVAISDTNAGTFPMGGGNGGACECHPDCIGQCQATCHPQCGVAGNQGAELGVGVGGLIGLVFAGRRRSRRTKRKSS